MSRHDFGAHYRNGAESEAGCEPKKKGAAIVPNLDRLEPKLEALVDKGQCKTNYFPPDQLIELIGKVLVG